MSDSVEPVYVDDERAQTRLLSSILLAYAIAVGLYATLIYAGGVWNLLANSRLLDVLLRGGIVQLTDADAGFIPGIPDVDYYVASQDPLDWGLLALAAAVFGLFWALKSLQFHEIGRFVGVPGGLGSHSRTHLYGRGLNRFLPFNMGDTAVAGGLQAQGASPERAAQVVFITRLAVAFEIVTFAVIGLFLVGFTTWLMLLTWASIIAAAAYLLVHGRPRRGTGEGTSRWTAARLTLAALVREPRRAIKIGLLSLVAFALQDVAAWTIAMAFSSPNIILHPDTGYLLMAIVAGYLARAVPLTPGGIGQFEWGFAAALYLSGMGMPEAVTIAVLYNLVRYVTGAFLFAGVTLGRGADIDLRRTFRLFRRPVAATVEGQL